MVVIPVLRKASISLLAALLLLFSFMPLNLPTVYAATGITSYDDPPAAWPSSFTAYTDKTGNLLYDPANEPGISPDDVDFTSGALKGTGDKPSYYVTSDATNLFFRMRMLGDPRDVKGGFLSSVWMVQLAQGGQVLATVGLDGKSPHTDYIYVANANGSVVHAINKTDSSGSNVPGARVTDDGSGYYFLDFQVPISRIAQTNPAFQASGVTQFLFATSKAANLSVINKDGMNALGGYAKLSSPFALYLPTIAFNGLLSSYSATPATISGKTGNAANGSTVKVTFTPAKSGQAEQQATATVTNDAWTVNVPALVNGAYQVTATVTNENNNTAQTSQMLFIGASNLTINGPSSYSTQSFPTSFAGTYSRSANGGGSPSVSLYLYDLTTGSSTEILSNLALKATGGGWTSPTETYSPSTLVRGHTYIVKVYDDLVTDKSVVATQTIKYLANVTITSPTNPTTGPALTTVTGTATAGGKIDFYIDGTIFKSATTDNSGNWTLDIDQPMTTGMHQFKAQMVDDGGNTLVSNQVAYTVQSYDISIENQDDTIYMTNLTPTFRGHSSDSRINLTVKRKDDSSVVYTVPNVAVASDHKWSVTLPGALNDNTEYVVTAACSSDPAKTATLNARMKSSTFVTISSPESGSAAAVNADVYGTAEPLAFIVLTINHASIKAATADEDGKWTYTPDMNWRDGANSVEAAVSDVAGNAATDSTDFQAGTPSPQQSDVTADDGSYSTDEDTPVLITLNGSSSDSEDTLTYTITQNPSHGSLSGSGANWTYTPTANYSGTDAFTFSVTSTLHDITKEAAIDLTVRPVDDAPTAQDQSLATDQETPLQIVLSGTDIDTPVTQLTYAVQSGPAHGQLSGTGGTLTYTPDDGFTGADSFTFTVSDATSTSDPATVQIQVNALSPLDGWVGDRQQGALSPYVMVSPGSPLKLSAVSTLEADSVKAAVNGEQVSLVQTNATTAATDGKKIWSSTVYRLPDGSVQGKPSITSGEYTVTFVAYNSQGSAIQQEALARIGEDNVFHVRTSVDLKGTIRDQTTGQPLAGAEVALYDPTGTVQTGADLTTGQDGKYHFDSIKTKNYLIKIKRDGFGTKNSIIEAMPADPTGTAVTYDFNLTPFHLILTASPSAIVGDGASTSALKAVLTDKDGKPEPGVTVEFSAPRGTFVDTAALTQTATTDAQGAASVVFRSDKIEGILSQNIPITATVNDPVHQLFAVEQIIMTFQPARITGVVTDNVDGRPVPVLGAVVKITKDFDGDGVIDFSAEAVTKADGSYSIAIPRGDMKYDVSITKNVTVAGQTKAFTFNQTASVGTVDGTGNETFASSKTVTGIIESKDGNGLTKLAPPVGSNLIVYFKNASTGVYVSDGSGPIGYPVDGSGVFSAPDMSQGNYLLEVRYKHSDGQEVIINRRADGSLPQVSVTDEGQMNIDEELIDPYGTISDRVTGLPVAGVNVVLQYADTARNRAIGITPNTQVALPPLVGFAPNDNANPQTSDVNGKYAFMVYAHTDYNVVASKAGYQTYTSPIITVETAIVLHDIVLVPISAPSPAPVVVPPYPEAKAATNVSVERSLYPEGSEVPVTVTFKGSSAGASAGGTVKLQLPSGVVVTEADGGIVEGSTITWAVSVQSAEQTFSFKPILKLPQLAGKMQTFDFVSSFGYSGTLGNADTTSASVKLMAFSNRYGEQVDQRYIIGYPDGTFRADRNLTRAELAGIMARLIGKYDGAEPGYNDVDRSSWAYGYIKAVTEAGLFSGYEDHRFLPNQSVTRAELVSVMVRYLKLEAGMPVSLHFTDIKGNWASSSIEALYRNHMVSGYGDGTFKPLSPVRRVEAVTFIDNMLFRGPLTDIQPTFPDIPASYWGFGHIEEASVPHSSTRNEQGQEHFVKQAQDEVK